MEPNTLSTRDAYRLDEIKHYMSELLKKCGIDKIFSDQLEIIDD